MIPEQSASSNGRWISPELVQTILQDYRLNPWGIHGIAHWARVLENGRRLAALTGARLAVVELFAVFHDARRQNDGWDHGHGQRGARLAEALWGNAFQLNETDLALLVDACARHTDGRQDADLTVQTCWDADRLDLARADIRVQPHRLSTSAARDPDLLAWANARSLAHTIPDLVTLEWEISIPG